MQIITDKLISFTEAILTKRANLKKSKVKKQKPIHPVLDWIGAFIWAACFVLIVNQYIFQAYVIPSRSMETTLNVGDRVIVNKFIYGPEVLPGFLKLPGLEHPKRSDVIIFENPEYLSKGSIFDLLQRFIFMLSLSTIDIDKDSNGNPAHHFLIKRSVGAGGDTLQFNKGELFIKYEGASNFIPENEFKEISNIHYETKRLLTSDDYDTIDSEIRTNIYKTQNSEASIFTEDLLYSQKSNYKYLSHISPSMLSYYQYYTKKTKGIYIPKGWILPLGDNRDNSKDGRYFGIINAKDVLGRANIIFWPFTRVKTVK